MIEKLEFKETQAGYVADCGEGIEFDDYDVALSEKATEALRVWLNRRAEAKLRESEPCTT